MILHISKDIGGKYRVVVRVAPMVKDAVDAHQQAAQQLFKETGEDVGVPVYVTVERDVTGVPIPPDEPLFLLRGQDRLAAPLLRIYAELCAAAGCDSQQLASLQDAVARFAEFTRRNRALKNPD